MIPEQRTTAFGTLLQHAREAAGLSRAGLAQRVGLDVSHIHRMESGERRPSRESALALAEALGVTGDPANTWLLAAGYAPMPLLTMVRGAVRTRGRGRSPGAPPGQAADWDTGRWAAWLETMGLQEATLGHLLRLMEMVGLPERQAVASAMAATLSHLIERLETPVHTAVIPAAGGQHRLLALHVMQRLLLRAIREAVASGIGHIILVVAPGMSEPLYTPLQEALALAVIPSITLRCCEQAQPDGLGDALLQAEALINNEPFVVLLPDDIVRARIGRTVYPQEIRRMMEALHRLGRAHLVTVTAVPKSKMPHCGVAQVATQEMMPKLHPIVQLIEKPHPTHPICRSTRAFGIVGRYLLHPSIFDPLRALQASGQRPVHLTDAIERLRQMGEGVYAFELEATRQDVGAVLGQADELIGNEGH